MSNRPIKLCSTNSGPEAVIIQSMLEGNGITYVMDSPAPTAYGITSYDTSQGPITFYVRKEDYEKAKRLLSDLAVD